MPLDINRREFATILAASAAAGVGIPRRLWSYQSPATDFFRWTTIKPNVHVAIGAGGNSLVLRGSSGAVLVDCKFLGMGAALREQAQRIATGPISGVFNTHHHGDHSGGNHVFPDATIVAQENAAPRIVEATRTAIEGITTFPEVWLEQTFGFWEIELDEAERSAMLEFAAGVGELDPESFVPDETFDRRLVSTEFGVELNWRHVGPGHTDNDAFLFLPEHNVMHAGDLLFFGRHAFMLAADGGNTVGWQRSLAAAIAACDDNTVVIPGHGPITDKTGLREQSRYFDRLRELVVNAMEDGRPRDSVTEVIRPEEFSDYEWADRLPPLLGIIYDELS